MNEEGSSKIFYVFCSDNRILGIKKIVEALVYCSDEIGQRSQQLCDGDDAYDGCFLTFSFSLLLLSS